VTEGRQRDTNAGRRWKAHLVHLYTASGVLFAFLAAAELAGPEPDVVLVFILLGVAVLIDASDGPLARLWEVKRWAPSIDGRTIDDIVDFLTYTFLPLLLVWRMGWVPSPALPWIAPALLASLFGFANAAAKDEARGYFLGFPSLWNVFAFYAGIWFHLYGPWPNALVIVGLALLTVLPVRFIYPNLAPPPWRLVLTIAAIVWMALVVASLVAYPAVPAPILWLSLAIPGFYTVLSVLLWRREPDR
jgi:phosphatidylcholine synthase